MTGSSLILDTLSGWLNLSRMSPAESGKNWKRARSPEQIEVRRKSILSAAAELLDSGGIEAAGLSAIARKAGLSKANLYRYFESREAILMKLLIEELRAWSDDFQRELAEAPGRRNLEDLADLLGGSVARRPRFCLLFASMAVVLEQNLSIEAVSAGRRELKDQLSELVLPLSEAVPELSDSQLLEFLSMHSVFLAGLWPTANPPKTIRLALENPELTELSVKFESRIAAHALVLLRGLEAS
ncbi:MAG: AcrR family transcriptional regulator [Verrucomicrobiales bacterium]|jgi:AcrR family transcriptional regulator